MGVQVRREVLGTAAVFSKICNRSFSVAQVHGSLRAYRTTSIKLSQKLECVTYLCVCNVFTHVQHYDNGMYPPFFFVFIVQ